MLTKDAIVAYYKNGQLEWRIPIEWHVVGAYRFHGEAQQFYPNGARKLVRTYEHGVEVGAEFMYYPDGSPMSVLPFNAKGQKHGEYMFFPKEGGREQVIYENGEAVGSPRKFDKAGAEIMRRVAPAKEPEETKDEADNGGREPGAKKILPGDHIPASLTR